MGGRYCDRRQGRAYPESAGESRAESPERLSRTLREAAPGANIGAVEWLIMKTRTSIFILTSVMLSVGVIGAMLNANESQTTGPLRAGKSVYRSTLAGSWYTADPEELRSQLESFLEAASTKTRPDIIAMIMPHAGYAYSGRTAARAVKALGRDYRRIIVMGPTHSVSMAEVVSVPQVSHYETPLGQVPLDTEFIEKLLTHKDVVKSIPAAHRSEHSVQIELPLLQVRQHDFKFVPMVVGQCSLSTIRNIAKLLRGLVDETTLVVVSTDFTHYGERFGYVPFKKNIPDELHTMDMGAYQCIEALDAKAFLDYQQKTGATICGRVGVAILLAMLDPSTETHLVEYTTSGALTGDYTNSVSYLSAVFSGQWKPAVTPVGDDALQSDGLSPAERTALLTAARQTIPYYLKHHKIPAPADLGIEVTSNMKATRAAFVTLTKGGRLRGCIGDIIPRVPLVESVIKNAVNAAVNDYRFRPVTQQECAALHIEISALTVPHPVDSAQDIRIGTDGVILQKGGHSAVFLPQVAPEQGWGLEETLSHLAQKAGLASDAWKTDTTFTVFQAEVFGEDE